MFSRNALYKSTFYLLTYFYLLLSSPNFSRLQSAYRREHSTETALLHVMKMVYTAADAKKITTLIGLDISAAFDTIDHDVLASRLESQFGVVRAASSWLLVSTAVSSATVAYRRVQCSARCCSLPVCQLSAS